jgi:hypothetical protein
VIPRRGANRRVIARWGFACRHSADTWKRCFLKPKQSVAIRAAAPAAANRRRCGRPRR